MSVFSESEDNQNTEETQTSQQTSFVETLVKLKGDQWSDPETIAKGKIDADNYIEQLKAELEAAKKVADQGKKVEDILAALGEKATQTTSVNPQEKGSTTGTNTTPTVSEDQIQSLVEKTLTQREKQQTATQNLNSVNTQLEELFGTEAKKKVEQKAAELGMSLARLQEIASESPSAFMVLIGEKPQEPVTIKGTIRTESVTTQNAGTRNNTYYQNLRKQNPNQFYSPEVQKQMMQDRVKHGNNFYN